MIVLVRLIIYLLWTSCQSSEVSCDFRSIFYFRLASASDPTVALTGCGWKGGVVRKHPPPSHVLSEGGGDGVVRKYPPPSRILSDGGGVVGKVPPSISHFKRGRGWCGWKGGVVRKHPPLSHISSEGGGGGVVRKYPPPSHILSDGGVVVGKVPPSVLRFKRGRGWWLETTQSVSRFE